MVAKVQRTEHGLAILLSPEMVDALTLQEGAEVEITRTKITGVDYASDEEALRSFRKTLPQFESVYRALAESERGEISAEEALATYRETLPDHEEAYRALAK